MLESYWILSYIHFFIFPLNCCRYLPFYVNWHHVEHMCVFNAGADRVLQASLSAGRIQDTWYHTAVRLPRAGERSQQYVLCTNTLVPDSRKHNSQITKCTLVLFNTKASLNLSLSVNNDSFCNSSKHDIVVMARSNGHQGGCYGSSVWDQIFSRVPRCLDV